MFKIAGYSGLAAAIVVAAFVAGLLFQPDPAGGVAFADVLQNVKKARSFTFLNRQKVGSQEVIEFKCYVLGDQFRMEMSNVFTAVGDFGKKKAMELNHATKTATMIDIADETAGDWFGFLRKLRQAKPDDVQPVGEKVVDGEKVLVYEYETEMPIIGGAGKIPITIEVDPKTKLPTRMVVKGFGKSQSGGEGLLAFEDFDWDATLDPGLFKLEVPAGYQVVERKADAP